MEKIQTCGTSNYFMHGKPGDRDVLISKFLCEGISTSEYISVTSEGGCVVVEAKKDFIARL